MIPIFGANTFIENVDGRAIIGVIDDAEEVMAKLLKIICRSRLGDYVALTRCKDEMVKIKALEEKPDKSEVEEEELEQLKSRFILVISADYQMSKLLPSWGCSPQPGSTYYLQKLSHDLFGIVNHSDDSSAVYIFD